jgi:hypothetical protein
MDGSVSTIRKIRAAASLAVLAVALAACETDGTGPSAAGAPKAQAASMIPEPVGSKPETPPTQSARPAAAADDGEPMTRARAARECWMRTEKANPHQDLDKRADVVNKCIDDKLKAAGAVAPKT